MASTGLTQAVTPVWEPVGIGQRALAPPTSAYGSLSTIHRTYYHH